MGSIEVLRTFEQKPEGREREGKRRRGGGKGKGGFFLAPLGVWDGVFGMRVRGLCVDSWAREVCLGREGAVGIGNWKGAVGLGLR